MRMHESPPPPHPALFPDWGEGNALASWMPAVLWRFFLNKP